MSTSPLDTEALRDIAGASIAECEAGTETRLSKIGVTEDMLTDPLGHIATEPLTDIAGNFTAQGEVGTETKSLEDRVHSLKSSFTTASVSE